MTVTIVPVENPERVRAELREFKRLNAQLRAHEDELSTLYPNEWIAYVDGQIFHARELRDLLAVLREQGLDPAGTPYKYIATDLPPLIL